jgi:phosphate starvation-inducible PhoH-like protein
MAVTATADPFARRAVPRGNHEDALSRESPAEHTETLSLEGIAPVDLLGRQDRNLRLIESRLPGRVVVRGDQVILSGPPQEVQDLKRVFVGLIEMVRQKRALSEADVQYAIDLREHAEPASNLASEPLLLSAGRQPVGPKTFGQRDYVRALAQNDVVFAIGPAGTGKTYLAIAAAVAALRRREVDRIVLARPAVEAGENLGFLPGDFQSKVDPYLRPLYDALQDLLGEEALRRSLENGTVEVAPLAYMRGRTLRHAFAILDEAQNATLAQVKMFLTRLDRTARRSSPAISLKSTCRSPRTRVSSRCSASCTMSRASRSCISPTSTWCGTGWCRRSSWPSRATPSAATPAARPARRRPEMHLTFVRTPGCRLPSGTREPLAALATRLEPAALAVHVVVGGDRLLARLNREFRAPRPCHRRLVVSL